MRSYPLKNFEIQKYYQNGPKNNDLPITKDGAHIINVDEYKSVEIRWITLYVIAANVTYFNPIQDGLFWGCSQMGVANRPPSLKSVTHILQ